MAIGVTLSPPRRRRRSKSRVEARACKSVAASPKCGLRLPEIAPDRCPAEHRDRSANAHRIEKRNRILLRHTHTAVRRGIARQISSMHSVCSCKSHEVMHWRRNKFPAARNRHVGVGVRHNRVPARIDNFPIHTRVMVSFFLENLERTRSSEMPITAARNRRRQNWPSILKEISGLFFQIDLDRSDRVLSEKSRHREEQNHRSAGGFPEEVHNLRNPAR
jgi:hypothetical protein